MANWWSYPTNYSNGTEVGGVGDFFFGYPAYILGAKFAIGIVVLIWISFFSIFLVSRTPKALMAASFIAFVFSIFFWMRGDLTLLVPVIMIILTAVGAIGSKSEPGL